VIWVDQRIGTSVCVSTSVPAHGDGHVQEVMWQ